jgi:hypothetical protein
MDELYDLLHDPYEMQNVIDRPESAEVLERLQGEVDELIEKQ